MRGRPLGSGTKLEERRLKAVQDAAEMELRSDLNDKIVEIAKRSALTHVQIAKLARMSRTRVTAILNRNTQGVSTDLMLRLLGALGYRAKVTVQRAQAV